MMGQAMQKYDKQRQAWEMVDLRWRKESPKKSQDTTDLLYWAIKMEGFGFFPQS